MNSLSSDIFPDINPFINLRIEGVIWIASIKGCLTVKSSSIFLHLISSRSLRVAFAGTVYGTLGTYSRAGTGSGDGRTASAGCLVSDGLVSTGCSSSFSAVGASEGGCYDSFCFPFSAAVNFLGARSDSCFPLLSPTALHSFGFLSVFQEVYLAASSHFQRFEESVYPSGRMCLATLSYFVLRSLNMWFILVLRSVVT